TAPGRVTCWGKTRDRAPPEGGKRGTRTERGAAQYPQIPTSGGEYPRFPPDVGLNLVREEALRGYRVPLPSPFAGSVPRVSPSLHRVPLLSPIGRWLTG